MTTESELVVCLRHTTEILEEWSRYHASEMTCDIAAALHNARASLAGLPEPGERAQPAAWLHPTAGWAHESYDKVRTHCMNDGPMPIPLYRGAPPPSAHVTPSELPTPDQNTERFNPATGSQETADQMAAVMLLHGSPEQQRQALTGLARLDAAADASYAHAISAMTPESLRRLRKAIDAALPPTDGALLPGSPEDDS